MNWLRAAIGCALHADELAKVEAELAQVEAQLKESYKQLRSENGG